MERIADFLFEQTPFHAARIARAIYDAPSVLEQFPFRGRIGRREGTRELVLPSLPYVVIYIVDDDLIHIVRILHGAQQWE